MHIPFVATGSYPVRAGNRVRPLIDGAPAFRRICEAIEGATHSVWATVAFHDDDFRMPDGRGSLFDVLDQAQRRGLDVRVNFWRVNDEAGFVASSTFFGSDAQRQMLLGRGSRFLARWDRAYKMYCQHQKSWLIDAGHRGEVAFVGGINLNNPSVVSPGHRDLRDKHTHDIYLELAGPCATDVHHNFVQRWNEASEAARPDGVWPDIQTCNDLVFPTQLSPSSGATPAQVQRTVRAGHYTNPGVVPGHSTHDIAKGETTVFQQYIAAIDAAKSTIYFENQALGCPHTVEALHRALRRGVEVVVLTPADANNFMAAARKDPRSKAFFDDFDALAQHERFTLAGIAIASEGAPPSNIYVHAKAAVIDDAWVTIGSCNIGARSFFGDTELNVSFWSPEIARQFRIDLLGEHLEHDTSGLDGRTAFEFYRKIATENAARLRDGMPMRGLAFAIDPRRYAM